MPMTAYYLTANGDLRKGLNKEEIQAALDSKEGLLWVDVLGTDEEDGRFMRETFKFHHLAVEDCISPAIHPPKIDEFGEHLFIIIHGINYQASSEIVDTAELAIFLGSHFVVTSHNERLYSVESITREIETDGRPLKRGADFFVYTLTDALVDNVLPAVDRISEFAGEIEEETIRSPRQEILDAILKLKRSTLRIHRVMAPQREVFNRLSRGQYPAIKNETQIFYRDIYDHVARIEDLNQSVRDRADNALATYLSSIANKQNETMKTLAVVATIFMPLTLLAGIYGMNFENMPELKWEWGYFGVLGIMLTVIIITVWRFWARGWFNWGRIRAGSAINLAVHPDHLFRSVKQNMKRHH